MNGFSQSNAGASSRLSSTKTTNASATTATVPIFRITGSVYVAKLYGIVKVVLGTTHTAAYFRINDQTAQISLTLITGTTMSAAPVGSMITKDSLLAVALTLKSAAAGAILEPSVVNQQPFAGFVAVQKTGAVNTDIEYRYTTADTPTSGQIQFFCEWVPLSEDGNVTAL